MRVWTAEDFYTSLLTTVLCVYLCVCVCVCVCVCRCMCLCLCACVYVYAWSCMCVCMFVCTCMRMHMLACTHTCVCVFACISVLCTRWHLQQQQNPARCCFVDSRLEMNAFRLTQIFGRHCTHCLVGFLCACDSTMKVKCVAVALLGLLMMVALVDAARHNKRNRSHKRMKGDKTGQSKCA